MLLPFLNCVLASLLFGSLSWCSLRWVGSWLPQSNFPSRWRLYQRLLVVRGCCGTSTTTCVTRLVTFPGTTFAWRTIRWTGMCRWDWWWCCVLFQENLWFWLSVVYYCCFFPGMEITSTPTSETCTNTWEAWATLWRCLEHLLPVLMPANMVRKTLNKRTAFVLPSYS